MRRARVGWTFGWLAATAVVLSAAEPSAKPQESSSAALIGGQLYKRFCATCHGIGGAGDGPVAASLTVKPADLTQLAASHDGVLPAEQVAAVIDGRELVAAHGPREMPVWGDAMLWPDEDTPANREKVKTKIANVIAFLRTIQLPAKPKPEPTPTAEPAPDPPPPS